MATDAVLDSIVRTLRTGYRCHTAIVGARVPGTAAPAVRPPRAVGGA